MTLVARVIEEGNFPGKYVVVLTKIDKPVARKELTKSKRAAAEALFASALPTDDNTADLSHFAGGDPQFTVPEKVARQVRLALEASGLAPDTPILASSAKSKLGRDDFWRLVGGALSRGKDVL
mmetsp:Transcript_40758/g.100899  ORF Transcript_40758/g.100899 Transcript_40758/m.100899 type:complete len:123 (-) Transcript_40758:119-487(-)